MTDLITRLSKLDAPDSDVDAEIAMQVCGFTRKNLMENFPEENPLWEYFDQERNLIGRHGPMIHRYTASVDAAMALAERVLPGWTIARLGQDDNKQWNAELREGHLTAYDRVTLGGSPNAAIALLIALLRAKEVSKL